MAMEFFNYPCMLDAKVYSYIHSFFSHTPVWFDGKMSQAAHGFHQSTATGAGEPVQTQQVPLTTQTLRSGHIAHADRNTGEAPDDCPLRQKCP